MQEGVERGGEHEQIASVGDKEEDMPNQDNSEINGMTVATLALTHTRTSLHARRSTLMFFTMDLFASSMVKVLIMQSSFCFARGTSNTTSFTKRSAVSIDSAAPVNSANPHTCTHTCIHAHIYTYIHIFTNLTNKKNTHA